MTIALTDWHGEIDLTATVCLGYDTAAGAVVTYWGTRAAQVSHVLALPSRAIDPVTLAEWCGEQKKAVARLVAEPDRDIAADLRAHLGRELSDALRSGAVRQLWPAAIGLSKMPDDTRRTAVEQAAEILRVEGYEVSPAAIDRERAKRLAEQPASRGAL